MYGVEPLTRIHVDRLTNGLCGQARPGHFDGVCTVVCKLLQIVHPHQAYFGEKDYQQLVVVRQMVRDLSVPVDIVACPTVRAADGLALSSRNHYLSAAARRQAAGIYAALQAAAKQVAGGERDAAAIEAAVRAAILQAGADRIEYASVVHAVTLAPLETVEAPARLCVAVYFSTTRLIDNIALVDVGAGAG
jgi:pantoate--beta-alanine ligase